MDDPDALMEELVMETTFQPIRQWFADDPLRSMFAPNAIISTSQPFPARWRIIDAIIERSEQKPENQLEPPHDKDIHPSFASLKLTCCGLDRARDEDEDDDMLSACFSMADCSLEQQSPDSIDPNDPRVQRRAVMRVYLQVPIRATENDSPEIRAQQATTYEDPELQAYKILSSDFWTSRFTPQLLGYEESVQGDWGHVPGGFYTVFVREYVPGASLCLRCNDILTEIPRFWTFERAKRDKIRAIFSDMLDNLHRLDIIPEWPQLCDLIWNDDTDQLYLVNFREWTVFTYLYCHETFHLDFGLLTRHRHWGLHPDREERQDYVNF